MLQKMAKAEGTARLLSPAVQVCMQPSTAHPCRLFLFSPPRALLVFYSFSISH